MIPYSRETLQKRSCGRPFAPYLNVRAGGLDGKHGAVVPCYVLGRLQSSARTSRHTNY